MATEPMPNSEPAAKAAHEVGEYPEHAWIGVDLDGTLAVYDGWVSPDHIGVPIPAMVKRVKAFLAQGWTVKIVTARVGRNTHPTLAPEDMVARSRRAVETWCVEHLGKRLEVTDSKDFGMVALYDDRAVQVETNTGAVAADTIERLARERDAARAVLEKVREISADLRVRFVPGWAAQMILDRIDAALSAAPAEEAGPSTTKQSIEK